MVAFGMEGIEGTFWGDRNVCILFLVVVVKMNTQLSKSMEQDLFHPCILFYVSMLKNWCFWTVVLEKTLETPLDCKEIQPVNPKRNQSWIFIGKTDAEAETPILWPPDVKSWVIGKKPWCWERSKAGEGDDRGWDGWMASPTRWTWVWASSESWWWTGKPGMLQSVGLQRAGHNWSTELNWNTTNLLLHSQQCWKKKKQVKALHKLYKALWAWCH